MGRRKLFTAARGAPSRRAASTFVAAMNIDLAAAGYIVARNYPDEIHDGHIRPDLQTWDSNPMNAGYTQVVQKRGGAARSEVIDVASLDAKFDEIYQRGGIYNFMSHPQWLDYGADGFYERHLAHISRRRDVWYVPMGPLYAYRTIHDRTEVRPAKAGFEVPESLVERHMTARTENVARGFAYQGIDPREVGLNWREYRENQREESVRAAKADILLDQIARREGIEVQDAEVDAEVKRFAQRASKSEEALRRQMEKEGELDALRARIREEKTLDLLKANARLDLA